MEPDDPTRQLRMAHQDAEDLRAVLDNTPDLVVRFGPDLRIVFANRSAAAAVGRAGESLIGRRLSDIGIASEQRQMLDSTLHTVFATGKEAGFEAKFAAGGRERYFHVHLVPELVETGKCATVLMASRDITRLKTAEKRLIESERRYRHLFENNLGLMYTHDMAGHLLSVNRAAASALGYEPSELVGRSLRDLLPREVQDQFPNYLLRVREQSTDEGLLQVVSRDGLLRTWKYCNALVCEPDEADYVMGSAQDVSDLKQAQDEARQLSVTDELTGLVNRRGFATLAEQQIRLMRREAGTVLLLYADVDDLKGINDRFGHEQGSIAIQAVGDVLKKTFRRTDIIARIGGDEFVVLVIKPRMGDQHVLPRRLQRNLREYNLQGRHPFNLSLSVGTALAPVRDGVSLEQLVNDADSAMYRNKTARNAS